MGMLQLQLRLAVVLVLACLPLFVVGGCKRPCETEQNCKRTCSCLNTQTNTRDDCTIAYKCDGAELVCEDAYDTQSCDEMCAQYAARALCGTERCASDADCGKIVQCPCLDAQGQPNGLEYQCNIGFTCELDVEVCEAASTASDLQLCGTFCPAPATCTGG